MKKECGIRKIWDELKHPNPLTRDLRIGESLLFNEFKQKEYEWLCEEHLRFNITV